MSILLFVVLLIVAVAIGSVSGFFVRNLYAVRSMQAAENAAEAQLRRAEIRRKEILLAAKEEASEERSRNNAEFRKLRKDLRRRDNKLALREEESHKRERQAAGLERDIQRKNETLKERSKELAALRTRQFNELERISGITQHEALRDIMTRVEEDARLEVARKYRDIDQKARRESEDRARIILAESIQRLASDVVAERTVSTLAIPNEDMKGRLIGREGRNIKAIQTATGADLMIDDGQDTVTISCFDPVRREVARQAVEWLVKDGRIQPARIEEIVEKARKQTDQTIKKAGTEALLDVNVKGLPLEIVRLLGRLKFRYSYGENVLMHSIEVSLLAGMLAAEVGANIRVSKTAGLLHDIGKALTHETEGPHAEIGANVARNHGLSSEIQTAIKEHHDTTMSTSEAFIVAAADAISAARPGARNDTVEKYMERLEKLENIAKGFQGVEKCFAIQAGREVRVMVNPNGVNDLEASELARKIANRIESTVRYSWQTKVVVIREKRAVEVAS